MGDLGGDTVGGAVDWDGGGVEGGSGGGVEGGGVSLEAWKEVRGWFGTTGMGIGAGNWQEMPPGAQVRREGDPGAAIVAFDREVGTLPMAPNL